MTIEGTVPGKVKMQTRFIPAVIFLAALLVTVTVTVGTQQQSTRPNTWADKKTRLEDIRKLPHGTLGSGEKSELGKMFKEENQKIHDFKLRDPLNSKRLDDEFGDGYYYEYYQPLLELVVTRRG
jgi:hypothetical protein